jgi:hypothetical protein
MKDWILKDNTYFTRNVSILPGDPIPFPSKFNLSKFDFIYNFYDIFFFRLYTHGSDLQKGKFERWPIDSILHTDYCQISRLPIATPVEYLSTGMVAITAWLSVAMTETVFPFGT